MKILIYITTLLLLLSISVFSTEVLILEGINDSIEKNQEAIKRFRVPTYGDTEYTYDELYLMIIKDGKYIFLEINEPGTVIFKNNF